MRFREVWTSICHRVSSLFSLHSIISRSYETSTYQFLELARNKKNLKCLALVEVAVAVAALLHPLVLLLRQLSLLGRPVNNPQEVPARQLTLQPTPSNLVLPLNKAKALGSSDKCSLQLRKHSSLILPALFAFPSWLLPSHFGSQV